MKKDITVAEINKKDEIIRLYKELLAVDDFYPTDNAFMSFFKHHGLFRLMNIEEVEKDIISYKLEGGKRTNIKLGRFLKNFYGHMFSDEMIRDLVDIYKASWIEDAGDYKLVISRKEEDFKQAYESIKSCMSKTEDYLRVTINKEDEVFLEKPYLLFMVDPKIFVVYLKRGEKIVARALFRANITPADDRLEYCSDDIESVIGFILSVKGYLHSTGRVFNLYGDVLKLAYFLKKVGKPVKLSITYYSFVIGLGKTIPYSISWDVGYKMINTRRYTAYFDESINRSDSISYDEENDMIYHVNACFYGRILTGLTSKEVRDKTMKALLEKNRNFLEENFDLRTRVDFNSLEVIDYKLIKELI